MKRFILPLAFCVGLSVSSVAAAACTVDSDCQCGQVCSWMMTPHMCMAADGGDPGWCQAGYANNGCNYQGQTCSGTACAPAWTPSSVCLAGMGGMWGGWTVA
jgi:hypothetical protein